MADKGEDAFRTIGELAADLGVPQHVLRYWETRFPQLRPLQRAGNRRYYRVADVALARRIHRLLNSDGYTVRGVQQLLDGEEPAAAPVSPSAPDLAATKAVDLAAVQQVRALLVQALADDELGWGSQDALA